MPGESFFVRDGAAWRATEYTRGPWSVEHQHGGPSAALLAGALGRRASEGGMQVVRLTVEFLRPILIGRYTLSEATLRPGKKVAMFAASLWRGDEETVRAAALCIREAPLELQVPGGPAAPASGDHP
jgi:acyl-coenzyme A thioesterase PaaI-like protein